MTGWWGVWGWSFFLLKESDIAPTFTQHPLTFETRKGEKEQIPKGWPFNHLLQIILLSISYPHWRKPYLFNLDQNGTRGRILSRLNVKQALAQGSLGHEQWSWSKNNYVQVLGMLLAGKLFNFSKHQPLHLEGGVMLPPSQRGDQMNVRCLWICGALFKHGDWHRFLSILRRSSSLVSGILSQSGRP